MRWLVALMCLAAAACNEFPRDPGGTLDRVRAGHVLRVGLTTMAPQDEALARAFLGDLGKRLGARVQTSAEPAEIALARLEDGTLDLVLGEFAKDTPWVDHAAVIEPLARRVVSGRVIGLSPVAANGENAFVIEVERAVRDLSQKPRL